jgi:hypothetical protein
MLLRRSSIPYLILRISLGPLKAEVGEDLLTFQKPQGNSEETGNLGHKEQVGEIRVMSMS